MLELITCAERVHDLLSTFFLTFAVFAIAVDSSGTRLRCIDPSSALLGKKEYEGRSGMRGDQNGRLAETDVAASSTARGGCLDIHSLT
jgi:hypothetical protein